MADSDMFGGFLHVSEGRLVDGPGEPVMLRGVGLGNWLLPEGYMWKFEPPGPQAPREIEALIDDLVGPGRGREFWERFRDVFITEADIAQIRAEGMNHVRLPINSRVIMDEAGGWIESGFSVIDDVIAWCRTHRLWVVLDLHGAPGGQTGTNIDDSPRGLPELFTDDRYRELTISLWRELATRYRDEPVVAAYDLLNEPLPNEYQYTYAGELKELYRDLTATVRAVDTNHAISYEGSHWATNWTMFDEVWDPNSILQFHKYWSPPDRPSIQRFIDTGERLELPIYMGEGGENNLDWIQTAFQLYEDCGISWNFWPWKKVDTVTSPCSVNAPPSWSDIIDYAAGKAEKPAPATAWETLTGLLEAMPLARCTYRDDVISALLRRAPLRIPATGFTFHGRGVSYETREAMPMPGLRCDDAVTIRHAGGSADDPNFHHTSGQLRTSSEELVVHLGAGDWTAYEFALANDAPVGLAVALRSRSDSDSGESPLDITIDGISVPVVVPQGDADSVCITATPVLPAGRHLLRLTSRAPDIVIRHMDITPR